MNLMIETVQNQQAEKTPRSMQFMCTIIVGSLNHACLKSMENQPLLLVDGLLVLKKIEMVIDSHQKEPFESTLLK